MADRTAVLVQYSAQPGQEERARSELAALVAEVREEAGCESIVIHQDPQDPTRFMLYERWRDRNVYLGEHMRTPHILAFIARAHEFLGGPPEISLWSPLED